jgi:fructosamine-3-kinase
MQCLRGKLLDMLNLTKDQAFKMGQLLAKVHEIRTEKYGDLTNLEKESDPKFFC